MNRRRERPPLAQDLVTELGQAPVALLLADAAGEILWANRLAETLLGWSAGELAGRTLEDLVPHRFRDPSAEARETSPGPSASPSRAPQRVLTLLGKDGRERPVEMRLAPLPSLGEGRIGAVLLDHTASRRIEQELVDARHAAEAADRAKSAFLAHMSHDLRTPLNAILGFARHLLERQDLPAPAREELQLVVGSGTRMLALVNDVLELSRIDAGTLVVAPAPTAAGRMLRDLAETFSRRALAKGLKFTAAVGPAIPDWLLLDEGKARLALENLLDNAIKFTATGGIELRARWRPVEESGCLDVEIEDSGPGIDLTELPRLLAPFEQSARGHAARQGTGLGLALAHRLAGLLGGQLEVTSSPGRGTRVRLSLAARPVAGFGPSRTSRELRIAPPRGGAPPRVLVAESDADSRALLTSFLRERGFQVDEAADGSQALERVSQAWPSAMVLDLELPKLDGVEVAERVRLFGGGPPLPILAVAARENPLERRRLLAAGVDTLHIRPLGEDEIFGFLVARLGLETEVAVAAVPSAPAEPDPLGRLAALPEELRAEMRRAAATADLGRLERAVAQACEREPRLAPRLTDLLAEFDYPGLLGALDANTPPR